jgi:hypothetical protein
VNTVGPIDLAGIKTTLMVHTMNTKFLKLLALTVGLLAVTASFVSAEEEKKDGKCPCEKEKPKAALVSEEEKKDGKCPCEKEKPKAAAGEEKKDCKCPCEKEKPKA